MVIGLVEGDTVHVSLDGLVMCSPHGQPARSVGHLPIRQDALAASLVALDGEATSPAGFQEGIDTWRNANGGVFTMPLSEIVETIEWGMNTPTAVLDHLTRELRALRDDARIDAMMPLVMRAVRKQPSLVFLSHPESPNAPLFWQFEGRSPCVVVFTSTERADDFKRRHGLSSVLITPPNAEAAFEFLRTLRDDEGIEWASVNAGHAQNVPFYLDQL